MLHSLRFLEAEECIYLCWDGNLDADLFRATFKKLASKEWFRPGLNVLHDMRTANLAMSKDDTLQLSTYRDLITSAFGEPMVAFVVSDQRAAREVMEFVFGRDQNVANWSTLVTTDLAEARVWLGIPDDKGLD